MRRWKVLSRRWIAIAGGKSTMSGKWYNAQPPRLLLEREELFPYILFTPLETMRERQREPKQYTTEH